MEFLGYGLDRVTFTVSYPFSKPKKNKFRNDIKEEFLDRCQKMTKEMSGTWAFVNHMIKNDAVKADNQGILSLYFDLQYPYACHVYINIPLVWRHEHKNYVYHGLHGQNYLPTERSRFATFRLWIKYKGKILARVFKIWRRIFNLEFSHDAAKLRFKQVEFTEEYNGHVDDLEQHAYRIKGQSILRYTNQTKTIYINNFAKGRQLKLYQKTPEFARYEWTFNNEYANKVMLLDRPNDILEGLENELIELKKKINFEDPKLIEITPESFVFDFSKVLKLTYAQMMIAITSQVIHTKGNQNLVKKFERRGLFERDKSNQGVAYPTRFMRTIKKMYSKYGGEFRKGITKPSDFYDVDL